MSLFTKKKMDLALKADLENAVAGTEQNTISIEDITEAVLELGELIAEQVGAEE